MTSRNPPHKWFLKIDPNAKRAFNALQSGYKRGIFHRLRELLNADDPYSSPFVEMLKAKDFERIRKFRVGNYRILFVLRYEEISLRNHTYKGMLLILDIRDRKEAYRP